MGWPKTATTWLRMRSNCSKRDFPNGPAILALGWSVKSYFWIHPSALAVAVRLRQFTGGSYEAHRDRTHHACALSGARFRNSSAPSAEILFLAQINHSLCALSACAYPGQPTGIWSSLMLESLPVRLIKSYCVFSNSKVISQNFLLLFTVVKGWTLQMHF